MTCIRPGCTRDRWREGVWCRECIAAVCCRSRQFTSRCVHRLGGYLPAGHPVDTASTIP